jgi:hypothetical protein
MDRIAQWVLNELLDKPTVHWSLAELETRLDVDAPHIDDAVAALRRSGLAHRQGEFVFPTRAAVECGRLLP